MRAKQFDARADVFEELLKQFARDEDSLHGNDYEKWDMRKPSVNTMLWSHRNILKKSHYAY